MKAFVSFLLSASLASIQTPSNSPPASKPASNQVTTPAKVGFGLEDGTPLKLRISRTVSSEDAQVGDTVDFEVLEEVKSQGVVLIPRAGIAWATVTEAQAKRRMGRAGKLNINIDNVKLVDGEKAPLRAVKDVKGGSHVGAMTGAIVATSIVFFPAAPLFLLVKGKDITIPKGTEITAYVNGDIELDPKKFQSPSMAATSGPASAVAPADTPPSTIELKSDPEGAEITVDGKYVGNTPTTLHLSAGDHSIKIEKSGFNAWSRTLTISPGQTTTINSTLEKSDRSAPQ